jgi:hypothetical protein
VDDSEDSDTTIDPDQQQEVDDIDSNEDVQHDTSAEDQG